MRKRRKSVVDPQQLEQMLDLPEHGQGLAWVACRNPGELLLVPGIHATSITAAAAGHQQALAHLRSTAIAFAALGKQRPDAFQYFCSVHQAACTQPVHSYAGSSPLHNMFSMRQVHTVQLMHNAAQEIEPTALKWLLALCHLHDFDDVTDSLMSSATSKGRLSTLRYLQASPYSSRMNAQTSLGIHMHLDCLKWLLEQDPPAPLHFGVLADLAAVGDLDTLAWLRAHPQVPQHLWHWDVTLAAAECGNLEEGCAYSSNDLYSAAVFNNHGHVLEWLHTRGLPVPRAGMGWIASGQAPVSVPSLMFLGDIGFPLSVNMRPKLVQARKTFCTFYGLLRWCSSAVAGKGAHAAFDCLATDHTRQNLLVHLSLLPQELITRIAVAAELQHGLSLRQDAFSMLGQPSGC
ncbi:hypothetical protein WJX74_010724 [Apatococcus lobatus]|uniref:Uncharacterized protein n=1 Tax=Apatococcus lobatus TaxID=904363 RepID=A0AAW1RBD7_9CHLO